MFYLFVVLYIPIDALSFPVPSLLSAVLFMRLSWSYSSTKHEDFGGLQCHYLRNVYGFTFLSLILSVISITLVFNGQILVLPTAAYSGIPGHQLIEPCCLLESITICHRGGSCTPTVHHFFVHARIRCMLALKRDEEHFFRCKAERLLPPSSENRQC